ncbi:hypothetical protein J6590_023437 [Homalodisca vitripennis]|nr:hypothetical protein J6590_023437 [Homalodisca vitripennis]
MAGVNFMKKFGSGKVYHTQAREIVANVYEYMKNEKESGTAININNVLVRVKAATGVPLTTIKKIVSERKKVIQDNTEFSTPKKNRNRIKPKTDLDNFDIGVIRRTINEFHRIHGERPTIKSLLSVLKSSINFKGSSFSLRCILKKINFRWKKTTSDRKVLVEKITQYRSENRPNIYMDETYIHTTHATPKVWTDDSNEGCKVPS